MRLLQTFLRVNCSVSVLVENYESIPGGHDSELEIELKYLHFKPEQLQLLLAHPHPPDLRLLLLHEHSLSGGEDDLTRLGHVSNN